MTFAIDSPLIDKQTRIASEAHLLIYPMLHSNLLNLFSLQGLSVSMTAIVRVANMQTEQQIDSPAMPKIAPQADSGESKDKRAGKQPGAGRKPNLAKILLKGVSRTTILAAVENVDVGHSSSAYSGASESKPA